MKQDSKNYVVIAPRKGLKILANITTETEPGKDETFICNTVNMSNSGVLIETSHAIPVGAVVNFSFLVPENNSQVRITGEVVREQPVSYDARSPSAKSGLIRYGIRFLDMKDEYRKALDDFLESFTDDSSHH
ncbi:MAG TPA: hypothetical protein ENJ37_01420 [Deltaproteobacteria bacterium]|nr:hypothetical protein [Deltaproteobacteria bacterium]